MQFKSPPEAAMYEALARVYDLSGQSRFSLRMVSYLLEILALRRLRPRRITDLACGTGAAAVALAKRRFETRGVDGSPAMLARARTRAARWGVQVEWSSQDLRAIDLPGTSDLALCLYDSLNHLLRPEEVLQAFFGARRALAPGGLYFFDMNTPHGLRSVWGGAEDAHLAARYARFWRAVYDDATGLATLDATYFVADEPTGAYQRLSVTHQARGYAPAEVEALLGQAGFETLAAYECLTFRPARDTSYRVAYLARSL